MTSFTTEEKGQLLNMVQYCGLSIVPLLTALKLMKMYLPDNNSLKPTTDLIIEITLQLIITILVFFFIHKFILYFPTYSKIEYDNVTLLSALMPLLFLMFTLDTKISNKLNTLFDRLLNSLGIISIPEETGENEKSENSNSSATPNQFPNVNQITRAPTPEGPSLQQYGGGVVGGENMMNTNMNGLTDTFPMPMDSLGGGSLF
jgi:hypothetical protein